MPQATGTYSSYDLVGAKEELADMIYRITPEDARFRGDGFPTSNNESVPTEPGHQP